MKSLLTLAIALSSISAFGANTSVGKIDFCRDRVEGNYVQELLKERESRMAFANHGGLANGGVCWWHSRFQRNAAYLTFYSPEKKRPTDSEAKDIIKDIRKGKKVVEIPGFRNFNEFSRAFASEIQDRLEGWQRTDGFINQSWITGLAGKTETTPEKLQEMMDELYSQVSQGEVVYQKLQLKGIIAHAWLVIDMEKTRDGYVLSVVDSNSPSSTNAYTFRSGMTSLHYPYLGKFVPYTHKDNEEEKLKKVVQSYCD
ncbi:MAG: hypothetical protein Fur0010_07260 [Bdellovibrio sp.]